MRHRAHLLCLALAAATSLTTCTVSLGEDNEDSKNRWSQWRGPSRTGIIEAEAWPNTLNESSLQVAWRVELGPSYSGPIVTDKHVFVTETVDEKFEVVRALKRDTGEEVWKVQWEGSMKVPFFANANGSWIRSTPCYDDGKLYVGGIRDVLVCLDAATGNEIWRVDFVKEHGGKVPDFGFVCSPMIDGDDLYIQAGGGLAKLNKNTGKLIWMGLKDGGGMMGSAFSSPIKTEINGMDQLVVQTRQNLCGVDPSDGSVLWSQEVPAFRGMNIVTPTVSGNKVFTSSYGG